MKNMLKRVVGMLMITALLASILANSGQTAQAATSNLSDLGLKWDLKKNKSVICKTTWGKNIRLKMSAKLTKYKVTDANKAGYKKLTFTVKFKHMEKLTKSQVNKILRYYLKTGNTGGSLYYVVADYDSGMCLEEKNDKNVTVKSKWKWGKKQNFYGSGKYRSSYVHYRNGRCEVSVVYPEDYSGLCIGFGAYNGSAATKADEAFEEGKKSFGKTSHYKKGKTNSHWMKVSQ
ncbi:MAG: hypothetical protein HFG34_03095 [Eubacterium sp.]|nr:hypothetical protein [Eubacterium sp.]